jgi:DUF4097 and DUF4098 domain-containing protein YvlB
MRKAWLVGLGLLLAPALSARGDEWTHQYPLTGRPELHVTTDDGSVEIESSDRREIGARVTTRGWRLGPDEVKITESQAGDRVDIEVRVPRNHGGMNFHHREIRVTLQVPREADLDIHTGDGSVSVQPVSGRLRIFTGDGSITADGLQGEIRLHTADGSIRARGLVGRLEADTGDGHIDVRGRFEVLDLRSGDGGIEAEVERSSKVSAAWSLRSGDGGITLRLPDDLSADLDAHTGDGHITLDFPVAVGGSIGRSSVRGTLGSGGPPLRVQTGDGSIHLQRSS